MRSIQYDKSEERNKEVTPERRSGIRESNKVREVSVIKGGKR